jgi:metal-responsive CopG/Arc/MetJ family transcriptional regulator
MQLAIELPDELGQELLQHSNVQEFVSQAIRKMLSEEKKQLQAKQELLSLMATIPKTVSLADELIQERRVEAKAEQRDNIQ